MEKLLSLTYLGALLFWIFITVQVDHDGGLYLQLFLFVVPFIGSVVGLQNARLWGGFKSAVGKAVTFISAGVLSWSIGMLFWNYYIFIAKIEVPYPSFADAAFVLSWPLWAVGVFYLSRATGIKFALREAQGKVFILLVPLAAICASYYLLIPMARGGIIELDISNFWKLFFDLFYPIGSAVIFTMTITFFSLSNGFIGGKYRAPIMLLIAAFFSNFFADVIFSYTTTNNTYFNGHVVDLMFVSSMYLFGLALARMAPHASSHKADVKVTS